MYDNSGPFFKAMLRDWQIPKGIILCSSFKYLSRYWAAVNKTKVLETLPATIIASCTRYDYLCHSGTNIMEVTNTFRLDLSPTIRDEMHTWHHYQAKNQLLDWFSLGKICYYYATKWI